MKTDNHTKLALVAAVLVGLFAVIAVNKYIATKTKVEEKPMSTILIARAEIKEGAELGAEMLATRQIPLELLSNVHISLPAPDDPAFQQAYADVQAKIVGRRVKRIIAADTPFYWMDIETEAKTPFADLIAEGSRAVTMPVDAVSSACGFIKPGSRVDVVLTASKRALGLVTGAGHSADDDTVVSSVILQNVLVIATDRQYDLQSESGSYGTITMNLPTKAAIMMVQARTMGRITYLLRNVRDAKTEPDRSRLTVAPGQSFGDAVRSF